MSATVAGLIETTEGHLRDQLAARAEPDIPAAVAIVARVGRVCSALDAERFSGGPRDQPWHVAVSSYGHACEQVERECPGDEVAGGVSVFGAAADFVVTSSPTWTRQEAVAATARLVELGHTAGVVLQRYSPAPIPAVWWLSSAGQRVIDQSRDRVGRDGRAWAVLDRAVPLLHAPLATLDLDQQLDVFASRFSRLQHAGTDRARVVLDVAHMGTHLLDHLEAAARDRPGDLPTAEVIDAVSAAVQAWRSLTAWIAEFRDEVRPEPSELTRTALSIARWQPTTDLAADLAATDRLASVAGQIRQSLAGWSDGRVFMHSRGAHLTDSARIEARLSNRWVRALAADLRPAWDAAGSAVTHTAALAYSVQRHRPELALPRLAAARETARLARSGRRLNAEASSAAQIAAATGRIPSTAVPGAPVTPPRTTLPRPDPNQEPER